jgi:hypothetical protein
MPLKCHLPLQEKILELEIFTLRCTPGFFAKYNQDFRLFLIGERRLESRILTVNFFPLPDFSHLSFIRVFLFITLTIMKGQSRIDFRSRVKKGIMCALY